MINIALLHNELANDPGNRGYAAFLAQTRDVEIAAILNAVDQSITVKDTFLDKDIYLTEIAPAYLVLATLSAQIQAKWYPILAMVTNVATGMDLANNKVQGMHAVAVADGVLTQAQVDALGQRPGSRIEQLFAPGDVVTALQVEAARKGNF